jgi:hypothetical protein
MKTIEGIDFENASDGRDKLLTVSDEDEVLIKNCTFYVTDNKPTSTTGLVAIDARRIRLLRLENVRIIPVKIQRKFVYGLRAGFSGIPGDIVKSIEMDRVTIGDFGPVASDYTVNRDAISIEGGQNIRLKDCIFLGAADGIIDSKMLLIQAKRCVFSNSHRLIRQWPNVKSFFSECSFSTPAEHLWHQDKTCQTTFYKCGFDKPLVSSNENGMGSIFSVAIDPLTDTWFSQPSAWIDKGNDLFALSVKDGCIVRYKDSICFKPGFF